jgi:predicted lysophospholipase L1 biosynthesis ABC-type transport system permease subunit
MAQQYSPHFVLAVAGPGPAASLVGPIGTSIPQRLPDVSIFDVNTAEGHLNRFGGTWRPAALALVMLGGLGLTIALVGLYGVVAYIVGQRRAEFGVRKVLGATNGEIYRLVGRDVCRMLALGILAGLPIAYTASLAMARTLVGIGSFDAVTFLGVPVCLVAVGLLAAWIPAHQAARVDPAVALREL